MGILDGFKFFIGKALAEIFLGVVAIAVCVFGLMLIGYLEGRKK